MRAPVTRIADVVQELEAVVDGNRVITDPDHVRTYASDTSRTRCRTPDIAVHALSTEEVQQVVKIANRHAIPVTPRSSAVGFYGAGIPDQGGIILDLSGMNAVRRIDVRNRWALFEAGVTHGPLQSALAEQGLRAVAPLLPHPGKSALTSCLEREPRLSAKHHLDEIILTMEMVLPTGDLFHTGSMATSMSPPEGIPEEVHSDMCNFMGPGMDWYRLIPGSLGTYGIVTVMNVKCGLCPREQKVFFIGFKDLNSAVGPLYHILRKIIGEECLLVNSRYLACMLADSDDDIDRLSAALPPYAAILHVTAGEWFPADKIAYQEEALHEAARVHLFAAQEQLSCVPDAQMKVKRLLGQPWDREPYWKWRGKGASREIFFLTPLSRAPALYETIVRAAAQHKFPIDDIGLYLQPKQHGRAVHMEAGFPYNPEDPQEKLRADMVFDAASRALCRDGAFFYRIYGPWAAMVYPRTGGLHRTLKRIKRILDPNNIMNPGKLGF